MKISSGWEQSIYVLLILSKLPENKAINSLALSERLNVSHSYLKKIIKTLVNEGLVKSSPGKSGGFSLATPLKDINFYNVFVAIEGRGRVFASQHILANVLDISKAEVENCAVSQAMDHIEDTLKSTMTAITLDSMLRQLEEANDFSDLDNWIKAHV
ncbi:RrF2 family transcriptional regulator [Pediococcus siamensis]|uniref:RrF2 family transcriptional regulator n=1 Tax=Pediococcus siamensis TaxID=381829 RepID=UPI0039A06C05